MRALIEVVLEGGKSAVDLTLYTLLPVMVLMMAVMRLLEAKGALAAVARTLAPALKPLGISGVGVFAMLQVLFVSFAAPVSTLAVMEREENSRRRIAATLAMVLAMSQANAVFPLLAVGLRLSPTLLTSLVGGLSAAAVTYYVFLRSDGEEILRSAGTRFYVIRAANSTAGESADSNEVSTAAGGAGTSPTPPTLSCSLAGSTVNLSWTASSGTTEYHVLRAMTAGGPYTQIASVTSTSFADDGVAAKSVRPARVLDLLRDGGQEGVQLTLQSIPMLLIAICLVKALEATRAIALLTTGLQPLFKTVGLASATVLPLATKYLAGGTAMMGVAMKLVNQGSMSAVDLNRIAGFMINPLDLVGLSVLLSAGPRVQAVARPAVAGAVVGILVRGILHLVLL